jgi:hypothetical protein
MTAPTKNPEHDRVGAGINHGHCLPDAVQARTRAKLHGADVAGLPNIDFQVVEA